MIDMAIAGKPTMGTSAASVDPIGPDPQHTNSVPRGNANPDADNPAKGNRQGIYERNGASYAPQVSYVYPNEQASGQTERNVRILPPSTSVGAFWASRGEQGNVSDV